MRFEEAYMGWQGKRLTQQEAGQLLRVRAPDVLVIAFAALVVLTQHALATNYVHQAIFDAMRRRLRRRGHLPNHPLNGAPPVAFLDPSDKPRLHGAHRALYYGVHQAPYPLRA